MATKPQWCDMPPELLSQVAERLELIDLLRFRAVCKGFLRAASYNAATVTAEVGSDIPWFLVYGGNSCALLTSSNEIYTGFGIEELRGATVLASVQGWLLVFRHGWVFFFCPFSGARMDLPFLPYSQLTNHVAAVLGSPTSPHCLVAIISRGADDHLQLNLCIRPSWCWTSTAINVHRGCIDTIKAASGCDGDKFYFVADKKDGKAKYLVFRPYEQRINRGDLKFACNNNNNNDSVPPAVSESLPKGLFRLKEWIKEEAPKRAPFSRIACDAARRLGVEEMLCMDKEDKIPMSICGTLVSRTLLCNESGLPTTTSIRQAGWIPYRVIQGVWIHPRFHQFPTRTMFFNHRRDVFK